MPEINAFQRVSFFFFIRRPINTCSDIGFVIKLRERRRENRSEFDCCQLKNRSEVDWKNRSEGKANRSEGKGGRKEKQK